MTATYKTAGLFLAGLLLLAGCGRTENFQRAAGTSENGPQVQPQRDTEASEATSVAEPASLPADLVRPQDLRYQGAFRLPEGSGGSNWEYSGCAMTYYADGDPGGPDDGYPGSIFALGHDHHQMLSEIGIPAPVVSATKDPKDLNTAGTLQKFHDIRGGLFGPLEIPRAGLEYLPPQGTQTTGKLHFCWGQHFQFERDPSHGWCEMDLSSAKPAGPWRLGDYTNYVTNDYLFEIPKAWADVHAPGLRLATGRFRDGTWGGLGPALLAYGPWTEGNPPAPDATLRNVKPLLMYGASVSGAAELEVSPKRKMKTFKEADEWSGGAWLTAGDRSAVILVGTKATGKCWYGFANGVVYPTSGEPGEKYPEVPPWPFDARGWWSEGITAQIIFYRPDDLAAVARGEKEPWEPQPYASLDIDRYMFHPGFDHKQQKRYLLGAAAFDRARGILYLVERRVDQQKSLVHVFKIR